MNQHSRISKKSHWNKKNGIILIINYGSIQGCSGKITHYLIDDEHSNGYDDLDMATKRLARKSSAMMKSAQEELEKLGLPNNEQNVFFSEIESTGNIRRLLERLSDQKKKDVVSGVFAIIAAEHSSNVQAVAHRESTRLSSRELLWPESGELAVNSKPYSVQLFVFEKPD